MDTVAGSPTYADAPPHTRARVAAALYLITIITGIVAQAFIAERLIVSTNAATTAANIIANPSLYRSGFTLFMVEMVAQIGMVGLFYGLLRPVNPSMALIAAAIGFTGCGIKALARLFYYVPLLLLGNAPERSVFDAPQLHELALTFIRINDQAAAIALIFFGFESLLEGWLMVKSTYFPRWLGVLGMIGGLGWLTFLWPPLGYRAFMGVALFALVASLATIVWMLMFGVREAEWRAVVGTRA